MKPPDGSLWWKSRRWKKTRQSPGPGPAVCAHLRGLFREESGWLVNVHGAGLAEVWIDRGNSGRFFQDFEI